MMSTSPAKVPFREKFELGTYYCSFFEGIEIILNLVPMDTLLFKSVVIEIVQNYQNSKQNALIDFMFVQQNTGLALVTLVIVQNSAKFCEQLTNKTREMFCMFCT